ncbi:MAG: hypothetical protein H6739_36930 [Alphaproteobacteria bacterium]|nr:hypothetical protein [Alphaproteobacteria bacterium]
MALTEHLLRLLALDLAALPVATRATLGRACFVLDPSTECFIGLTLPRLLRHLRTFNERQVMDDQGQVRGHIHWPSTLKARGQRGPGEIRVRRAVRSHDLPENQLLIWLLREIEAGLAALPPVIHQGTCYTPGDATPVRVATRLGQLSAGLGRARRDPRLARITLPLGPTATMVLRAQDTGMVAYQTLALLCVRLEALARRGDVEALLELGRRSIVLPASSDGEGLLWARLGAAQVSHQDIKGFATTTPPPRPAGSGG